MPDVARLQSYDRPESEATEPCHSFAGMMRRLLGGATHISSSSCSGSSSSSSSSSRSPPRSTDASKRTSGIPRPPLFPGSLHNHIPRPATVRCRLGAQEGSRRLLCMPNRLIMVHHSKLPRQFGFLRLHRRTRDEIGAQHPWTRRSLDRGSEAPLSVPPASLDFTRGIAVQSPTVCVYTTGREQLVQQYRRGQGSEGAGLELPGRQRAVQIMLQKVQEQGHAREGAAAESS